MALIHDVYQGDDEESILSSLLQVRRMPGPFMWQRASARILERADGSLCAVWEH